MIRPLSQSAIQNLQQRATASSPPGELSLVAFEGNICLTFLFENFVWRSYGTEWLELAALGRLDAVSSFAIRGLSHANFGKSHHSQDLQLRGAAQYGQALKTLTPELSRPTNPRLLIPILILLLHSSLHTDQAGSVSHVRGMAALLWACGPEAFQHEPMRSAFESCRATLITVGLIARQRTFLEEERWKTVPWERNPAVKSPQNQLADILVLVPGFLEDDARLAQDRNSSGVRHNLLDRVRLQLRNLFHWRYLWEAANPNAAFEMAISSAALRSARPFPARPIRFRKVLQATEIMLYDAVLLWLLGLLWRLDALNARSAIADAAASALALASWVLSANPSPLLLPGQAISLHDPAVEVCRMLEHHLTSMRGSKDTSLFYFFPVGLAWCVLEKYEAYREWIRELLNCSPFTQGYATGSNSFGFGFYLSEWGFEAATKGWRDGEGE